MFYNAKEFNQNIDSWRPKLSVHRYEHGVASKINMFGGAGCSSLETCGPTVTTTRTTTTMTAFVATDANIFCHVRAWCAGADGKSDGLSYESYTYDYVGIDQHDCDLSLFDTMSPPASWERRG